MENFSEVKKAGAARYASADKSNGALTFSAHGGQALMHYIIKNAARPFDPAASEKENETKRRIIFSKRHGPLHIQSRTSSMHSPNMNGLNGPSATNSWSITFHVRI